MYHSESQSSIDSVGLKPEILLVDDSQELLYILSEFFVSNGFETCQACSVNEAIEMIDEAVPDLVLCDVMLPGKPGYSLHEYLKRQEYDIPFIFLTAVSDVEKKRDALEQGCDAYLEKPFNPEELLSIVRGKVKSSITRKELSKKKVENDRRKIIHTLSHEFRTPLVAISTGSELLLEHGDSLDAKQLKVMLKSIRRGGMRLEKLIDDFMVLQEINLGRAKNAQRRLAREFNLIQLLDSCVKNFSMHTFEELTMELSFDNSGGDVTIRAYDAQVEGIIKRLLSNAVKFGAKGSQVEVEWSVAPGGREVIVSVRDYGPGIEKPKRVLERAFEAFSQIDRETTEQQGCGLGLAIALYFAKINSAELTLGKPEQGQGLLAQLIFPIR